MSYEFPMSIRTGVIHSSPIESLLLPTASVEETLQKGRDNIERYGWQQGEIRDGEGRLCLVGGLLHKESGADRKLVPVEAMEWLSKVVEVPVEYLDDWNDAPGRTKEEVLAAYDKALELYRASVADEKTEVKADVTA